MYSLLRVSLYKSKIFLSCSFWHWTIFSSLLLSAFLIVLFHSFLLFFFANKFQKCEKSKIFRCHDRWLVKSITMTLSLYCLIAGTSIVNNLLFSKPVFDIASLTWKYICKFQYHSDKNKKIIIFKRTFDVFFQENFYIKREMLSPLSG